MADLAPLGMRIVLYEKGSERGRPWGRPWSRSLWVRPQAGCGDGGLRTTCSEELSTLPRPEALPSPGRGRGGVPLSPQPTPQERSPRAYVTRVALCTPGEQEVGVVSGYFHPLVLAALWVRGRCQWRVFLTPTGGGQGECRAERGLCSWAPLPRVGGRRGNP